MDDQVFADAQRLWQKLGPLPGLVSKPTLVAIAGLPGTGKSYFARRLVERWPAVVLESDALRRGLFPQPTYSPDESARLFRAIHLLIEMLLRNGTPVILDATNLSEKFREPLYDIAERMGVKLVLVWMEAPTSVARARLESRSLTGLRDGASDADWPVYVKMKTTVQKIRRRHFVVDSSGVITPALDRVVRELDR